MSVKYELIIYQRSQQAPSFYGGVICDWVKNKTMNIKEESSNFFNSLLQKAFYGEL